MYCTPVCTVPLNFLKWDVPTFNFLGCTSGYGTVLHMIPGYWIFWDPVPVLLINLKSYERYTLPHVVFIINRL
jgi:hypothetical protein